MANEWAIIRTPAIARRGIRAMQSASIRNSFENAAGGTDTMRASAAAAPGNNTLLATEARFGAEADV